MPANNFRNNWSDRDVELHWDRVSGIYVQENNKVKNTHDQRFREGVSRLSISSGMKILNISSRDAEANDYLIDINPDIEVLNAEISGGLIKVAEALRPSANNIKIDSYSSLPFKSGIFDRILSLETLEHVARPLEFLNELHRVGKAGCRMVLSCPPRSAEFSYQIYTMLFGGHGEGPHKFLPPGIVKQMFNLTGWRLLEHTGTLLIPVGPLWIQKMGEKVIRKFTNSWISNLGIRQFYVCERD